MSKRKRVISNYSDVLHGPSHKRRKKHKKHKKKKSTEYESDIINVVTNDDDFAEEEVEEEQEDDDLFMPDSPKPSNSAKPQITTPKSSSSGNTPKSGNQKKKRQRGRDSGTSSEEERWLDAIESGKLEEVDDELKKIKPKDPKLMTARQRAMYERNTDKEPSPGGEILMSLPSGYKEKVMTAEAIQRAHLKSQKRKQMADEKREKDKKKTMERLLKKQDSKTGKVFKNRPIKMKVPSIRYKDTLEGATISFPLGIEFPLKPQHLENEPPKPTLCSMDGCNNIKRYNCSKTNVPLCSLQCYKRNIAVIQNIIC